MKPQQVRLVIANDYPGFRYGLRHFLEHQPDLKVLGQGSAGAEAVKLGRQFDAQRSAAEEIRPHSPRA